MPAPADLKYPGEIAHIEVVRGASERIGFNVFTYTFITDDIVSQIAARGLDKDRFAKLNLALVSELYLTPRRVREMQLRLFHRGGVGTLFNTIFLGTIARIGSQLTFRPSWRLTSLGAEHVGTRGRPETGNAFSAF